MRLGQGSGHDARLKSLSLLSPIAVVRPKNYPNVQCLRVFSNQLFLPPNCIHVLQTGKFWSITSRIGSTEEICQIWLIRAAKMRRLQVFDNRCLRTTARVGWCRRNRNETVRKRSFGFQRVLPLKNVSGTRSCVGLDMFYACRTIVCRRECCISVSSSEWRKQRGGQSLTWQRNMKKITKRLGAVGATRLPGWGPRDPHCAWLETLQDMAANRFPKRSIAKRPDEN
ncbi:hypothetical protein T265_11679 [Opisthorchis viverrini]|uniref:Uncharacterized protein n=1 Tax=Opisthorchis viverrini TaxID=6198 RepID=A0A074Z8P6_OPIVI|nr:hypothetical protein T265_11679 [Opisthorchis viverrini]KER19595.1 hypothetical protein T265_11679 [Opisthorchis viverrini]